MTTFLLILVTNLLGLCGMLAYLVYHWRERALVAEAFRQIISDKSTDAVYIKATGEPALIERAKPPVMEGGGFLTGRQRMAKKMEKREYDAVPAQEVIAAALSPQDMEHLDG